MSADHVLGAMKEIEFDHLIPELEAQLAKYRKTMKDKKERKSLVDNMEKEDLDDEVEIIDE